jgi:general secretion pathway protein E
MIHSTTLLTQDLICSKWTQEMALHWQAVPVIQEGQLFLLHAQDNPHLKTISKLLHWHFGYTPIHSLFPNGLHLDQQILQLYSAHRQVRLHQDLTSNAFPIAPNISTSLEEFSQGSVADFVHQLLLDAIESRASDIHFDMGESFCVLRQRIDGKLTDRYQLSPERYRAIVARIKILANLDTAETRRPQDGRIKLSFAGRRIDLRVSFIPIGNGERAVIRILDTHVQQLALPQLGMPQRIQDQIRKLLKKKGGLILVTGPTGSGKTTTLYSMVQEIASPHRNIMTIEDPIEYILPGIAQMPVNPKIGVTFATGLRHLLRQDPDILLVGEIRDVETAEIALQASLTGHLVLSTLHTEDAPSAIVRLHEMGIAPYLISGSLKAVLAQRLVKKSLEHSSTTAAGRTGVFQLLTIDSEWEQLLASSANYSQLRIQAKTIGLPSLYDEGMALVEKGIISVEDLLEVVDVT